MIFKVWHFLPAAAKVPPVFSASVLWGPAVPWGLASCWWCALLKEVLLTATAGVFSCLASRVFSSCKDHKKEPERLGQALQRQREEWEAQQSLTMKAVERGGQSLDTWEQRFTLNIKETLVDSKITINVCLQEVVEWNRSSYGTRGPLKLGEIPCLWGRGELVRAGNIGKLLVNGLPSANHSSGKAGLSWHMPLQMATQSSVHTAEHILSMASLICSQNKWENTPKG